MMAQRYPDAYDAILAGAPAIQWDRFQAYQIWPQVAMKLEAGGPMSAAEQALVTSRAVAACDALDGVTDGVIGDPRAARTTRPATSRSPGPTAPTTPA